MAPTCPIADGSASVASAARIAMPARVRSGHSDFAMPQTACATIATATTFRPCTAPEAASDSYRAMPWANRISATADGSVKPSHAHSEPAHPARSMPSAMPTWLLAGPGRNWQSATRSA
jgi:hypothetical protein